MEITGKDEWFDRMVAIEEDLWKHAHIDTPYGKIPSDSRPVRDVEVDGEQLQALCRLYAMTGRREFLTWAERLGDYYLKRDSFVPPHLRDHGCEIVGGLGLLVGIESEIDSLKLQEYLPAMKKMLDAILARGTNPDGFMYNAIDGVTTDFKSGSLSDGWGYNYVGFLCYDMQLGAAPLGRGVAVVLSVGKPYEGILVFDIPRHREFMGLKRDWPRMNTVPEWFTVEADRTYRVTNRTTGTSKILTGKQLREGLSIRGKPGETVQLAIQPE